MIAFSLTAHLGRSSIVLRWAAGQPGFDDTITVGSGLERKPLEDAKATYCVLWIGASKVHVSWSYSMENDHA